MEEIFSHCKTKQERIIEPDIRDDYDESYLMRGGSLLISYHKCEGKSQRDILSRRILADDYYDDHDDAHYWLL